MKVLTVTVPNAIDDIFCSICDTKSKKEEMYLCDAYGCGHHKSCLGEPLESSIGYFFCKNCDN